VVSNASKQECERFTSNAVVEEQINSLQFRVRSLEKLMDSSAVDLDLTGIGDACIFSYGPHGTGSGCAVLRHHYEMVYQGTYQN